MGKIRNTVRQNTYIELITVYRNNNFVQKNLKAIAIKCGMIEVHESKYRQPRTVFNINKNPKRMVGYKRPGRKKYATIQTRKLSY